MPDEFDDSESIDLPTEVNPDAIQLGDAKIFGILPIRAAIIHDTIEELEERHDDLLETLSETPRGVSIGYDDTIWEMLNEVRELDPEKIDSLDDVPDEVTELISPEVDPISEDNFDFVIEEVQEAIGESGRSNVEVANKTIIASEIGFDILSYFTFTSAVIEQRSAYLLREFLIAEEVRQKEEVFEFVDEKLSQHQREELLYDCGVIDGNLKNNLAKIRSFRNRLVHDPKERQVIDSSDIEELVSLAFSSVKQLDQDLRTLLQERYA